MRSAVSEVLGVYGVKTSTSGLHGEDVLVDIRGLLTVRKIRPLRRVRIVNVASVGGAREVLYVYLKSAATSNAAYNAAYIWTLFSLVCTSSFSREPMCSVLFYRLRARLCLGEGSTQFDLQDLQLLSLHPLFYAQTPGVHGRSHEAFDRERWGVPGGQ